MGIVENAIDFDSDGTESAMLCSTLSVAKSYLERGGFKIISLEQNADLIMRQGKESPIGRSYNLVREGTIYFPEGRAKLVRISPIMDSNERTMEMEKAYRKGKEFYLSSALTEEALEDSTDWPGEEIKIPVDRFGDGDFKINGYKAGQLTIWAFGGENRARVFGEFLKEAGTETYDIWPSYLFLYDFAKRELNGRRQQFLRPLWFTGLNYREGIYGGTAGFYDIKGSGSVRQVRGIKEERDTSCMLLPLG